MNPELTRFQLAADQMTAARDELITAAIRVWGEDSRKGVINEYPPDDGQRNGRITITLFSENHL